MHSYNGAYTSRLFRLLKLSGINFVANPLVNNLSDYGLAAGNSANLVILPAESGFDAVRRQTPVRYSIRQGAVIAETRPAETTLHLQQDETVDFRR